MTERKDPPPGEVDRAKRVQEISEGYLEALQEGKEIPGTDLLAAHPELAPALEKRLAFLKLVHGATLGSSLGTGARRAGPDRRRVKCPHCGHVAGATPADGRQAPGDGKPPGEARFGAAAEEDEITCSSCGSSFRIATGLAPAGMRSELPRAFGRFEVLAVLGRGSFGTVYRARDRELGRLVAIKVPRTGCFITQEEEERFLREARSAALLRHPGIVQVHEIAMQDGVPYIVSEYIAGRNLAELIADARPGFRSAAELVARVAEALDYAHGQKVTHRDIKPANILLDAAGVPHVADFGLARRDEEKVTVTIEGQILGTPAYMPPEQARGEHDRIDARSDVYSVGVVLFELLTGERPFVGSRTRVIQQVLHDEPRTPRSLNDHIPRDLETICLKTMAKEPGRRYASAAELADDLRRFLRGEPIRARPVGRVERAWRWCRRKPVVASLTTAVAALLLTVAVVSMVLAVRMRQARDAEKALSANIAQARDEASAQLSRLNVATGFRLLAEGDLFGSLGYFAEARRFDRDRALRDDVHRLRMESVLRRSPKLVRMWFHEEGVSYAEISPRGDRALTVSAGKVWIRELAAEDEGAQPLSQEDVRYATFNPSGTLVLAAGARGTGQLWDAETRAPTGKALEHAGAIFHAAFSPDGARVVTSSADRTARMWDGTTGEALGSPLKHDHPVRRALFSPDSRRLLTLAGFTVLGWRVDPCERVGEPMRHTAGVNFAAFSPDGTRVATTGDDLTARIWDFMSGRPVAPPLKHRSRVTRAAFTPDGKKVVTASWDSSIGVWDASSGERLLEPMVHVMGIPSMALSPDGRQVVNSTFDGVVKLHEVATGRLAAPPLQHADGVAHVAFSADGRRLITASGDSTARIWDLATGELEVPPLLASAPVERLAFSGDGKRLITGSTDGAAQVWDAEKGRPAGPRLRHQAAIRHVAFASGGTRVLTASVGGGVRMWSAETGEPLTPFFLHGEGLLAAALSPDGRRVATAGQSGRVRIWDATTGAETGPLFGHQKQVQWVDFSPDGRLIVTTSADWTARLWRAETGEPVGNPLKHSHQVHHAVFSPDGRRVATGSGDHTARIWDATTGDPVTPPLEHHRNVMWLQFSPDGRRLATGCRDGTARVWDAATGKPVTPRLPHREVVGPVAFSPDGRLLVSCGYDDVAMVWDAHTGEQVTPPLAHADDVLCAAFSPDGTRLATGGVDSVVRIWRLSTTDISLDDQLLLSRALSGRQVDETGGFRRLRPDELKEVWSRLRARHPRALEPEPHDALAWHSRQALACESQADWAGAAAHLRAVLELRPGDLLLEERMAGSLASAGRFAEAAAAFASVVKLSPTDSQAHLYLALTRWAAGDLNGYREACAQMVERFGGKEDVATRTYLTWACAVGPQAGVDLGAVIQAAEALVAAFPRDHNHANTLAVLLYRAGRLDDALKQFEVCFRIEADGNIWDWLFLAMLHQRLGRPEEAGRWLDKARAWSEVQLVDGPVGDPRLDWPHTAMARMFLREAEEIVKGR